MVLIFISGFFALSQLNVQFLPTFPINVLSVQASWQGASYESVYQHITQPFQESLNQMPGLRFMKSVSSKDSSRLTLEFAQQTNLQQRYQDVIGQLTKLSLPQDIQGPYVNEVVMYEPVAKLLFHGFDSPKDARFFAEKVRRQMIAEGFGQVDYIGVPQLGYFVDVPMAWMMQHQMSLGAIASFYQMQLKGYGLGRDTQYADVQFGESDPIDRLSHTLMTGSIDNAQKAFKLEYMMTKNSPYIRFGSKYGSILQVKRTQDVDALKAAEKLDKFLVDAAPKWPKSVKWSLFDQKWQLIKDRIDLLKKNGAQGLLLILVCLFLLLQFRVAFWVAMAIPISLSAAVFIIYLLGGSINMISMFSLIMCLGIVVDDTVVVAERIYAYYQDGMTPLKAAVNGASDMVRPIMAASMTTVGAFVPLLILDGLMGDILRIIPITAIAVVFASLIECFFILPTHMYHACQKANGKKYRWIEKIQRNFLRMRDYFCDHVLRYVLERPVQTVALFASVVAITLALLTTGRMPFDFFPQPDQPNLNIEVDFHPNTTPKQQDDIVNRVIKMANNTLDGQNKVVEFVAPVFRQSLNTGSTALYAGLDVSQKATLLVQLTKPDQRSLSNDEIMKIWPEQIKTYHGVRNVLVRSQKGGPPAKDFYAMLYGASDKELYDAAQSLKRHLKQYPGVYNIRENLPEQKAVWVITPNARARELGLSYDQLSRELLAAMSGLRVKQVQDPRLGKTDISVRLDERIAMPQLLSHIPIFILGERYQIADLVDVSQRRNTGQIHAYNGDRMLAVEASLDKAVMRSGELKDLITKDWHKNFRQVKMSFSEQDRYQDETFASLHWSVLLGLMLIFIVIAWVTASLMWSLVIMLSIPFGLIGGIWLHKLLGLSITLLSVFGFFGLAGIVVNNAIILVLRFNAFYPKMKLDRAITMAVRDRFRAMFLTTVTTALGLIPLLFETSVQAAYLKPMVAALCGGLLTAALMVLLLVPVLMHWLGPKWQTSSS